MDYAEKLDTCVKHTGCVITKLAGLYCPLCQALTDISGLTVELKRLSDEKRTTQGKTRQLKPEASNRAGKATPLAKLPPCWYSTKEMVRLLRAHPMDLFRCKALGTVTPQLYRATESGRIQILRGNLWSPVRLYQLEKEHPSSVLNGWVVTT